MHRLYLTLFSALLILVMPRESDGVSSPSGLTGLQKVSITVDLEGSAIGIGLNERSMRNQILVSLKSKLPRLQVSDEIGKGIFGVNVYLDTYRIGQRETLYYGAITTSAMRTVVIKETGQSSVAFVWTETFMIAGPSNKIRNGVREALHELLTQFAAQWYRDNP